MNFPVFGDAEANSTGGQACATLLEAGKSILSCIDRDPLGKIAYFALPYRLSKDPVVIDHLTLGLKVLVFLLFIVAAARVLRMLSATDGSVKFSCRQSNVGYAVITILALAICLNNIPVRLADMEAACCSIIAVGFALAALRDITKRNEIPDLYIFLTCFFMDLAGLFKQSFFAREALLIIAFALCLPLPTLFKLIRDWRIYALIILANVGVAFQVYYVWLRFGTFGITIASAMEEVAKARSFPIVGMEIFTLPQHGAYMLSVSPDVSRVGWFFYKIYYALTTTDPFVYGGFAKTSGMVVATSKMYWVQVYFTVLMFFGTMAASIRFGSRAIRLVTLTALLNLVFIAAYQHIEPRYHIFPKVLLVILAIYWVLQAWNALPFVRAPTKRAPHDA